MEIMVPVFIYTLVIKRFSMLIIIIRAIEIYMHVPDYAESGTLFHIK